MQYEIIDDLKGLDEVRLRSAVEGAKPKIDNWAQAKVVRVKVLGRVSGRSSRENKFPTSPCHDGLDFSTWKFKIMPMVRKDLRYIYTIQVELVGLPKPKFVPVVVAPRVTETVPAEVKVAEPMLPPVIPMEQGPQEETLVRRSRRRRKVADRPVPTRLGSAQMSELIDLVLMLEEPKSSVKLIAGLREDLRRLEEKLAACEERERQKIEEIEDRIANLTQG